MFDLGLPWWEFIVRGVIVYLLLLVLIRVSGKRTVGQFTPFDLLVVMLFSESVSNSLSGGDNSLMGGLIIAATLVSLNILVAYFSARDKRIAELIDGKCVLLGRDGEIFFDALRRCRIAENDVYQTLREEDVDLKDVKCIFLEADGKITVLKKH